MIFETEGSKNWQFVKTKPSKEQKLMLEKFRTEKSTKIHDSLTLNLLTTTIVAPPSNASKW